jgi:hypothetical protein
MGVNGHHTTAPAADLTNEELIAYMQATILRLDALTSSKGIILLMEALAEACYRRADMAGDTCKDPRAQDFWNACGHWHQAGAFALTSQWGRGKELDNGPSGKKLIP